jgi:exodeoxyribonuclease V alpha subunit
VFARSLHDAEAFVAADVANRLSRAKREPDVPRVRRWLQAAAQKEGWRLLSPAQEAFLDLALREPISVLTGGPGTGKTFATHIAVRLWRAMGRKELMCAPTGRAAQRLAEIATAGRRMSQPVQSSTIHRLLETRRGAGAADGDPDGDDPDGAADGGRLTYEGLFARDASSPLDADVVVVDESSMLDLPLCAALLDAVKPDAQLVFVGDADQLPSVGPGSVLRDLLNSGAVPAVQLREVFRQAEQSGIVRAAHAINAGRVPDVPVKAWDSRTHQLRDDVATAKAMRARSDDLNDRGGEDPGVEASSSSRMKKGWSEADCVLVTLPDDSPAGYESALESLLFGGALPALAGLDPAVDLQVLTPFRRGPASTTQLNAFLQARLNPPGRGRLETRVGDLTLREGDRVLQQRNDYAKEVFNGDLGTVVAVDGDGSVRVVFGGAGTSGAGASAGASESTRENDDDIHDAGAADAADDDRDERRLTDTVAMASRSLRHGAREVSYSKSELRDLIPAWALTVHKAQGSEYRAVVLCLAESHRPLLRRELAYTAASRAKEVLVILAPGPALELAVRALGNNRRCTTLARRLEPLAPDAPSCPAEAAIAAAADEKKRRTKPPSDDQDDAGAIQR